MKNKNLVLFGIACVITGLASGIFEAIFNNFLSTVFNLNAAYRGLLELPREAPGFIIVFLAFTLFYFLGDLKLAIIANTIFAVGLIGMGYFTHNYVQLCIWLFILSSGMHIYMPLQSSIAVSLMEGQSGGALLGRYLGISTAASICGFAIVWLGFKFFAFTFQTAFTIAACVVILSVFIFSLMHKEKPFAKTKSRLVFKKSYTLFYIINILYGARKQIFLTFAPWVIVKVFGGDVGYFAALGFFGNLLGVFFRPYLGRIIDKLGEKFVLRSEAIIMVLVCLLYASGKLWGVYGIYAASFCYIVDQMLMSVSMARVMYIKRIAVSPEDISPTVAMGVSIDHVVAMTIPLLGGILWESLGFYSVFIAGSVIAFVNIFVVNKIKM